MQPVRRETAVIYPRESAIIGVPMFLSLFVCI